MHLLNKITYFLWVNGYQNLHCQYAIVNLSNKTTYLLWVDAKIMIVSGHCAPIWQDHILAWWIKSKIEIVSMPSYTYPTRLHTSCGWINAKIAMVRMTLLFYLTISSHTSWHRKANTQSACYFKGKKSSTFYRWMMCKDNHYDDMEELTMITYHLEQITPPGQVVWSVWNLLVILSYTFCKAGHVLHITFWSIPNHNHVTYHLDEVEDQQTINTFNNWQIQALTSIHCFIASSTPINLHSCWGNSYIDQNL